MKYISENEKTQAKIMSGNLIIVYVINKMGCNKSTGYNQITFDFWSWVEKFTKKFGYQQFTVQGKKFRCRWRML